MGHSQLNRHLSVMGIINDPTCNCEEGLETAAHVLRECIHCATLPVVRQDIVMGNVLFTPF